MWLPLWQTEEMKEKGIEVEFQPDIKVNLVHQYKKETFEFLYVFLSVHICFDSEICAMALSTPGYIFEITASSFNF